MIDLDSLFPKAQGRPVKVREALQNCLDYNGPILTNRVKQATVYMIPGNYSGDIMAQAMNKVGKSGGYNNKLTSWHRESCTLPKMTMNETGVIHPDKDRYLSIGEAKRIASYPDAWKTIGDYKDKWERIGNSVPPLLCRSIARHIRQHILTGSQTPRRVSG